MTEAEQNRLITENMGLIPVVAAKYRGEDVEYEDLLGVGRLGLVVAARTFNPSLGKFSDHACARIESEIMHAIRSGDYARGLGGAEEEEVKFWESWGDGGNARAIYEEWPDNFDGSPETLAILYDDIKDKKEKFNAAFISLTPLERKFVQLVYLRDPPLPIVQAAREARISYLRGWRILQRALHKMRKIVARMENNRPIPGSNIANGLPPKTRLSRLSSRVAA